MLFLTPWRKDFRYFLKKQVGDLSSEQNVKRMVDLMFSMKLVSGITGSFWYNDIAKVEDLHLKEVIQRRILESDKSLGSLFKILVEEITAFKGYSRFCLKFPVYVNYIPQLIQWYPQCKIVHITRDPRAMAISRTNDPEGTQIRIKKNPRIRSLIRQVMVFFVIFQYIWTSHLHCKYRKYKNYELFHYEALLENPEKVIRRLCEFTEIDFVPEMLQPKEGQASSVTGRKHNGFNRTAASHWRDVISPVEERLITLLTKTSMERFEYDPDKYPALLRD